ncbi:MAG: hypothetical protein AAF386_03175 [Pseudomonadota bacterium]
MIFRVAAVAGGMVIALACLVQFGRTIPPLITRFAMGDVAGGLGYGLGSLLVLAILGYIAFRLIRYGVGSEPRKTEF